MQFQRSADVVSLHFAAGATRRVRRARVSLLLSSCRALLPPSTLCPLVNDDFPPTTSLPTPSRGDTGATASPIGVPLPRRRKMALPTVHIQAPRSSFRTFSGAVLLLFSSQYRRFCFLFFARWALLRCFHAEEHSLVAPLTVFERDLWHFSSPVFAGVAIYYYAIN